MENSQQWCYSFDNSNFKSATFDSKEAAIESAKEDNDGQGFVYVAPCAVPKASAFFPDADLIIEHMAVSAADNYDEHADDYPDASTKAEDELTVSLHALLEEWCEKNGIKPTFYMVGKSEKVEI